MNKTENGDYNSAVGVEFNATDRRLDFPPAKYIVGVSKKDVEENPQLLTTTTRKISYKEIEGNFYRVDAETGNILSQISEEKYQEIKEKQEKTRQQEQGEER